jgi:hypothetical protein
MEQTMKKRYLYALLFGMPGLFLAGMISVFVFAALTGILWLYVLGDNPWPSYVEPILAALFLLTVLAFWIASILIGYIVGRKLEKNPQLNKMHIWLSAGLTLLFVLLIVFHQWSVGNPSPRSDSALCSNFCTQHGYSGSGMPPEISGDRTCSCYDESGNAIMRIPLDHLNPDFGK